MASLRRALDALSDFKPATLIVSLGIDTHGQDPICDFALTSAVYHEIGGLVAALDVPMIVLQEGEYYLPHLGENVRQWLGGAAAGRAWI